MENDNSRAIISDLIFLAYADGKLTDSEYDFILQIALRLDLTEVEVQDLFDKPSSSRPIFTELESSFFTSFEDPIFTIFFSRTLPVAEERLS